MHPDSVTEDADNDSIQDMLLDPNHQWITAETVDGQFDDVDSGLSNGNTENDAPRKYRRTD